jgi:hypothetical protein
LGSAGNIEAQNGSPVGTWDCVITGAKNGLAYLTFSNETNNGGTFDSRVIVVPKASRSSSASLIPGMVAGLGSNNLGPRRPDEPRGTNLFGSFPIIAAAPWALDDKGRVNGSFVEVSKDSCTTVTNPLPTCVDTNIPFSVTNQFGGISDNIATNFHLCFTNGILQTNLTWSATSSQDGTTNMFQTNLTVVNTNFFLTTNCSSITNSTSFIGRVVPGKRITLSAKTPQGSFVLRGVPASGAPLASLSGQWLGIRKKDGIGTLELFNLSSRSDTNTPNTYLVDGAGPDYLYTNGLAILSAQKKIAISISITAPDGDDLGNRVIIGTFNPKKLKANMAGLERSADSVDRINFQIQKRASGP